MPGDDQPRIGGQLLHAVLRPKVRFGAEGLGDGRMLVQVRGEVQGKMRLTTSDPFSLKKSRLRPWR